MKVGTPGIVCIGLALVIASSTEALAVPDTMSVSLRIADAGGPIDGEVNLEFELYDAETGGTSIWSEFHTGALASDGLVHVALGGEGSPLDATVFADGPRYLAIVVNGAPQSPRLAIRTVPFAFHAATAETAETLGGLAPVDVALATHAHAEYAASGHDHDASYAPAGHGHAGYASTTHDHATAYAALGHTHDAMHVTSGILPVARGGTGIGAIGGAGAVCYSSGAAHAYTSVGAAGSVLASNGAGAPGWVAANAHDHDAGAITSGTLGSGRLAGAYTGITGVGTISGDLTVTGEHRYAAAKTRYVSISAAAFTPATSAGTYATSAPNGNDRYLTGPGGLQRLVASVSPVHGSVMTELRCWLRDTSSTYDITFGMLDPLINTWRCGPTSSSGSAVGIQQVAASCTTPIDNQNAVYQIAYIVDTACGNGCSIYGCRLQYTTTFAD